MYYYFVLSSRIFKFFASHRQTNEKIGKQPKKEIIICLNIKNKITQQQPQQKKKNKKPTIRITKHTSTREREREKKPNNQQ